MIVRVVVTQFERAASRISSQLIPAACFYVALATFLHPHLSPFLSVPPLPSTRLSLSVDLFPPEQCL